MLNSLTAKVAFVGGVGLTTALTLGHSFFGWGGQSNQRNTDTTSRDSSQSGGASRGADSQSLGVPQKQVNKLKESNSCYSAIAFNSKDYLLACIDKNDGRNLAFYYYISSQSSDFSKTITSLKAKRELGQKLSITLKGSNGEDITPQKISYGSDNSNTPWFWSSFSRQELQLNSLCQQSQIFTEHNSGKQPLTCPWEIKGHINRSGREVWQSFDSWA